MLCKGTEVNLGLILNMPFGGRNILEACLALSCLQQEMFPDTNSTRQLHLIKKNHSPQSNPNLKNRLNTSYYGSNCHKGIFDTICFHANVNLGVGGREMVWQRESLKYVP